MIDTVVIFAGHRVDEPGRNPPRFPPQCESRARRAIESVMRTLGSREAVAGIAGAADGGDILFHEVCSDLGIISEVCLALPAAEYLQTSVQPAWTERFKHLLATHPVTTLERGPGDVWRRDHEWQMRRALDLKARRTLLLALAGDLDANIPGGTSGMVNMARENRLEVIHLDTRAICART